MTWVRTRTNGNVLELPDETAKQLIDAKIYEKASPEEIKRATSTAPLLVPDETVPAKPTRGRKPR